MKKFGNWLAIAFVVFTACSRQGGQEWLISAPAGDAYTRIDTTGMTILPNGRKITPLGRQIIVAPHPYGLTLGPDDKTVVTANSGVKPFSISILRGITEVNPQVQQVPPGADTDAGVLAAVFMGLAIAPNNRTLYVGGGQEGAVILFDLATGNRIATISCNTVVDGRKYEDSYIGDLVLTRDGKTLIAVDQTNFRIVIVDVAHKRLRASLPVGRYPFGIALTPDEKRVYVANVGMYAYSVLPGFDNERPEETALAFPPFGYLSPESVAGTTVDGKAVPGLGAANVPESFSVWAVDIIDRSRPRVTAKIKTGILVGEKIEDFPAVGGSSPNSVVATDNAVFVSNGNNDCVSVIDTQLDTVVASIDLRLDARLGNLRGVIPFGLALSPDSKRLYVAEAGINAVAVVDVATRNVLGHLPVGWFPAKLAVSRDGNKLIVANAKGFGSGPNAGQNFIPGPEGSYIGGLMKGTVSVFDVPPDTALSALTEVVVANNFTFRKPVAAGFAWRKNNPVPLFPGEKPSPIRHIVFITKENRTYDEVFGAITGGRGDAALARYGARVTVKNRDASRVVENTVVMPNHLALAQQFALADNFYCDSDVSADGHRWLVGIYPNEWVETGVAASYGGGRKMQPSTAPGVLGFVGSSGAVYPEDYNEAGSIWDHFARHQIDFFNFGLGFEFAPGLEKQEYKHTGIRLPINYPMPGPLFAKTSRLYPTYNTSIPDQFRVKMFVEEFETRWFGGDKTLPPVITMMLPNDHGAGERPADGYPFVESYMADNDLAVGRVIDYLSHTRYWRNMAIFVTEDDPQGGVDHIDAHRSLLLVISPYAKRNYAGHGHYSFGSIVKTFWHILGLPYLNQYDAGAADLAELFTDTPDFTPFVAVPVDSALFDPARALDPLDEAFDWESLLKSPRMDDPETMQKWMREDEGAHR